MRTLRVSLWEARSAKRRLFFFTDYRRNDRRLTGAANADVPNEAFRNGDFSAYAATNPIFDPATGNPDGSGRTQFPNNIIPSNRFNPVAVKLLGTLAARKSESERQSELPWVREGPLQYK